MMRELLKRFTFGLILVASPVACQTEGIVEEVDLLVDAGVDVDGPEVVVEPDLDSELPDADMDSSDADAVLGPDMPLDLQPDESGFLVCQPELAWSIGAEAYQVHYGESSLYLSPTGELVALQSGMAREFFDPATGHSKGTDPNGSAAGLEGDWTLDVTVGEAGVLVSSVDTATEAEVMEMPAASDPELTWLSGGASAVSADSSLVAAVACWRSVGGAASQTVLGVWQMPAKVLVRSVELGQECHGSYWLDAPIVLFAGSFVVARLPGSGLVHVVGVESPVHQQVDLAQGQVPAARLGDELVGYQPLLSPVVRLAVSPDGGRLASVTHDGKLRIHLLPSLEETGPTIQAGFSGINMATYGPSMASPVAWSPDGRLLAHMSDQGTTSVSRADTGEVVFRVENPPTESEMAGPDPLNPPIAFLFPDPEPSLIVAHEFGRQRWLCATAP